VMVILQQTNEQNGSKVFNEHYQKVSLDVKIHQQATNEAASVACVLHNLISLDNQLSCGF